MATRFEKIVEDIREERAAQDAKFGVQRHPNGTSPKYKPLADSARNATRKADLDGTNTWFNIGREEFWEAMAETDPRRLREELIQLISVGVAWVECIDEQNPDL